MIMNKVRHGFRNDFFHTTFSAGKLLFLHHWIYETMLSYTAVTCIKLSVIGVVKLKLGPSIINTNNLFFFFFFPLKV